MEGRALVLIALVAGAIGGPISQDKGRCAKTCTESSRFNYETGKTYEFSYKADTVTALTGAAEEHSSLHIRATADIEAHAPCDFVLKMRDVRLEESDPRDLSTRTLAENSAEFARALEAAPLSFAFQDGRVEALCAATADPVWVLNIKRGVLSAFQNSMEHTDGAHTVQEIDVAGTCDAEYSVIENADTSLTVKKSKNLLGCTSRNHHVTAFQATPYTAQSSVQSLPLLDSHHDCEQTVSGGVLQASSCTEKHVFRPFSHQANGASTSSVQKLELLRHHRGHHNKHHGSSRRTDLLFEHAESSNGRQMERSAALATLRQICESSDLRPTSAQLFSQLTYNLRQLDTMTLSDLHTQVHDNRVCEDNHGVAKKFMLDAIPMVGTTASVSLIRDLVMGGHVTGMQADQWLTSLAFVAGPSADMLREIRPLLEAPEPQANTLLAVSALTRTFCRQAGSECADNMDVQDMVRLLTNLLGAHCSAPRPQVLMALKALGNLGQGQVVSTLARCAAAQSLPTDVRVAAMSASRGLPCQQSRRAFLDTFADAQEDAEVRVHAYLAAMACPNSDVIAVVRRMLEKEEVNQVGSFVWTHLTNLQETNDPFKAQVKTILADETLIRQFDLDQRKFSRNYEGSVFFDSVNTGAKMESNLIWSSKSYVPRSAMLNLTVDLFGHSVNLLEVGGRVEGAEHLIESLFGPKGYFPDNAVSTALRRARRSANDDRLDRAQERIQSEAENQARGSLYMKMFGNELRYLDLDSSTLTNPADNINVLEVLLKLANHQEVDFSKSFMFLDSSITVPTIVGVPMKLAVNGSATVKMALGGKMDVRQAASSPRSMDINGYIKPSGAVEVSSLMSVDAFVARTGLKMVSTLHSSTELTGLVTLQDSQVLLGKLSMPKDKIEIVSVESKFFVVHREQEREQRMLTEGRYTKSVCSGAGLKKALGVELCGELEYPRPTASSAPYFPLTGPAGLKVFLNKADSHSSYDFEARLQTVRERHSSPIQSQVARLSFNTPGSRVNRELFTDVILNHQDKTLSANLRSPWKKAVLNGALVNEETVKRAALTLNLDDTHEYSINSDMKVAQRGKKVILTPTLKVSLPGVSPMTARGSVRAVPGDMANAEVTVENVFAKPLTLKGGYDKEVRKNGLVRYTSNLEVRTDAPLVKASASLDHREGLKRAALDVTYRLGGPRHRLHLNGQTKDAQNRATYTVNMAGDVTSTQFPALDNEVRLSLKQQPRHLSVDADLRYGQDAKTDVRRILLSHESNINNKARAFNMDHTTKLTWKAMNIDVDSKIIHKHSDEMLKTKAIVNYAPGQKTDLSVHVRQESASPLVVVADAALSYPGRQMSLHEKLEEKSSGYAHQMALQWAAGSRLTSSGEVIVSPNNKYDLRLEVTPPAMPSTVLIASTSLNVDDFNAEASVESAGQKYAASSAYKYVMMRSAEAKLDLQYPSRQITVTSTATLTPETGVYEADARVLWDARRDASKKAEVSAMFKQHQDQLEGRLDLVHVNRKVNVAFSHEEKNGKYVSRGEATWAPGKTASLDTTASFVREGRNAFTMEGRAHLLTPLTYLEDVLVSVEGQNTPRLYTNKMGVSWRQQEQLTTAFTVKKLAGWRNIESQMAVSAPSLSPETLRAAVDLNTLDNQLALHTEGALGSEKIEVHVTGSHDLPASVQASIKAKTPFRAVRRVGASLGHSLRNGQLATSLKGFLNNQKVDLSLAGKHLTGRDYRDASVSLTLKTPFTHLEHVSGEGKHTKNGNKFTNTLELSLGYGKTIAGALDLIHQLDSNVLVNNGHLRLSTPFRAAQNLVAKWAHDVRANNVKVSYETGVNSQVVKADLTHAQGATHLKVETPFEALRTLVVDGQKTGSGENTKMALSVSKNNAALMTFKSDVTLATKNFDGKVDLKVLDRAFSTSAALKADVSPYTGHVDLKWDNNRRVSLSGDLAVNSQDMRGNLRFVSPIQNMERLLVSAEQSTAGEKYTGAASFEYAAEKKVEVTTVLDKSSLSLAVKSPCRYLRAANLQVNHKQGHNKVNAAYAGDDARVSFDSNLRVSSLENINADVKFTSSMTEDLVMTLVHKKVGGEYHTDADLQYAPRQKVEVNTVLSVSPDMKMEVDIKTPFYQLRNVRTALYHSGEGARFQNRFNFNMMAAGEKTELAASTAVHNMDRITSNVRISHPRMETVDLTLNHNMGNGNSHTDFTFGPSQKIDIDVTSGDNKVSFSLKTPFTALSQIKVNGEYKSADALSSKFDVSTVSYGQAHKLSGHFNQRALESLDALLMLETPANTMTLLAKHGQFSNDWVSTAALSYSPEKTVAVELNYNPAEEKAILTFNSPFKGFEDLRLSGATKSGRYMRYGKVTFNYDHKTVMTEMKVRFGKKMGLYLDVATPCQYLRSMTVNTVVSGTLEDFTANAELSHNKLAGKVNFDAAVKAAYNDIDALVTFTSPFPGAENLKLKVNHKEQGQRQYTSSLEVAYATNKVITLRGQLGLHSLTDLEGQMTFSSPCPTFRSMEMAFKHNGDLQNLKSHLEVQVNDAKKTELDLSLQIADAIRTSFKAVLPGTTLQNVDLTFSHSGQWNAFQTQTELTYNTDQKVAASADFNARSGVQSRVTLITPFTEDLIVTVSHDGDLLNFNHNSKVQYANQHTVLKGGAVVNGDIDVQFELDTPYPQVRKAGIVLSHKGSISKFDSGLRLFLNQEEIYGKLQVAAQNGLDVVFKFQTPYNADEATVELSHSGHLRAFTSKAMLTYAPETSVIAQTSFNMGANGVTGSLLVKSPFAAVRDLAVNFDHKNIRNGFTQDASVVHNGAQLAQVKNMFSMEVGSVEGSFVVTSPYDMVKEVSLTFNHNADKSNVILSMNGVVTRADMTLKNTNAQKKVVLRFQSPIPHANDVSLSASADLTADSVFGAVEFNCDDFKGIKAEAEYQVRPELAGRVTIETPFRYMEKHSAAFTYAGAFPTFRAHAEVDLTHVGKIQLDSDLAISPSVVGQIKLQTPFRNANEYSIVINHEGPSDNFKSKVVVSSKEHFSMEGNANLKLGYESAGSVSFTSDLSAVKDFSASFNRQGDFQDFSAHAEATCSGCGKVEVDSALSATRAQLVLQTPFTNMKKYSVVLTKTGALDNFKSKVVVASREHFKMEGTAELSLARQSAGSLTFTSDINALKDFSASFSHTGDMAAFTSHAEASCTNCGKVIVDAGFAASPLRADFKLQTPFKNAKQYSVTFNKDGPNSNFKSMVSVASQEHFTMELSTYLKTQGAMAGGLAFTSDISAIRDFSGSFSHAASNGQFRSHAEVACSGCGKMEVDGDFAMSPAVSGEFKFQSPIKNMKLYSLTFNHDGDLLNFESRAEVKSQEHATFNVNANLKTTNGLEGAFAFRNSLNRNVNFNVAFNHAGNKQAFRSHAEFNAEGLGAVSADADFRSLPSIVGNFHLATPVRGLENLRLNIKHTGEMDSFKSSAEFTYGYNQVVRTSVALKTNPSVDFNLKVETPFSAEHEIVYTHTRFPGRFTGSWTHLKNKRSVVHYEVSFDATSDVQGSLKFQTTCPYIEDVDVSFKGNNQPGVFKSEAQASYGQQTIRTEVDLKTKGALEATFKLNTPWRVVKDVEMDLTHKSWKRRVQTEVHLKHNGQKYETKMNLKFRPNIDGEFSVKTPFSQARDVVLTITHQGDLSDFDNTLTLTHNGQQKINSNVNFKVSPRIAGSVSLKTSFPQVKDLQASFAHSGSLKQFSSQAAVSHNGQQLVKTELTAQTYPSLQASGKFSQSVLSRDFSDVAGSVSLDGSLSRFRGQMAGNLDGKKVLDAEMTFSALSTVQGELKVRTPGNDVQAVLSHDGSLARFTSAASLTHNGQKKFDSELTFAAQPTVQANLKVATPFSSARSVNAAFSHRGSLSQFATSASVSHNGVEKFTSQMSFRVSPSVEARFDLNTPFTAVRQFSALASHTGDLNKFVTSAQATFNNQQALDAQVILETAPVLKVNFKFETPHTKLQDAGIKVKYEGHAMDFVVDASAQYKGQVLASTLVKFQLEGTTLKTQFSLQTPYTQDLNLIYNHQGALQGFTCHAEVNHIKADLTLAVKDGEVTLTLKSPSFDLVDFSASAKYSASTVNAELQCLLGKFEFDGSYKKKPMAVQLRLATPFEQVREVSFDMSHRGNHRAMFSSLNVRHNGQNVASYDMDFKNYARTVGNVQFKSIIPYMEKMAVSLRHEMTAAGLKSEASAAYYNTEVSTEANFKFTPKVTGTVTVNTPFKGFKRTSLKVNSLYEQDLVNADATLKYGAGHEISVSGNFERQPSSLDVSVSLNMPFRALRSAGAGFKQQGTWSNLQSSAQVELNRQVVKVDSVYREQRGVPVEASVELTTPFRTLEKTSLRLTDAVEESHHQPRAVLSWGSNQQIQLAGNYNLQQGRSQQALEASLTLTTPWAVVKETTVSGTFGKNAAGMNADVQLTYNTDQVFHAQTAYKNSGNKHAASLTLLQPHPMSTEVEYDGTPADFTAKASLQWDSRHPASKVSTEVSHKLEGALRKVAVKVITASRTTGVKTEFEHSAQRFVNKVELIWDEANDKKVSYDVSLVARPTRYNRIYEGRARLDTPIRSLQASLNHKDNGQVYETSVNAQWDAARDASRQLTLTNTYENSGDNHRHQLTIAHPKMAKDIVLRNEWSMNHHDIIYSGRTEIEYSADASDTLVMSTLVQDHSGNYSLQLGLSHPQSKLDVKVDSHLANTPRTFSAGMGVNYMTARRKVKNMSLRGEIEKIRKQLNVELLTPVKKLQLNGKVAEKQNGYSVNVVATEDEDNQVSAKLNLDTKAQTVDMKAFFSPKNPKNMMHMYGKYIDGTSLVMEATRHQDGLQVVEGQVQVNLKDKHLLHSKVYWRPDAMEDAWFTTRKTVKLARQDIAALSKTIQKAATKESRAKLDHMRRALPDLKPLRNYLHNEARSLTRDVRVTRNEASRMFDQNEFYVKTTYRFAARQAVAAKAALTRLHRAVGQYTAAITQAAQAHYNKMAAVVSLAVEKCNEMCDVAVAKMTVVAGEARRAVRMAINKYDELYAIVLQKCTDVCDAVLSKIDSYVEVAMRKGLVYFKQAWSVATDVAVRAQAVIDDLIADLMSYPSVRAAYVQANHLVTKATGYARSGYQSLSAALSKVNMAAINNAYRGVRAHLETLTASLSRSATYWMETSFELVSGVQSVVTDYVQRAVNRQETDSVRRYMQQALNKVSAAYTKYEVEAHTKAFVRDVVTGSVNFVKKNVFYLLDNYLHLDQDKVIEWSPEAGRLEVQAYLPLEAPSLQTVPFVNLPAQYRRVKTLAMNLVPDFDYSPMDTYYKYKPSSDVSNWLPPFKAHATLAGRQHYQTFDGKHYEFAAPCSYLLARDFIDGNFSMAVNYDGVRTGVSKRSVTVTSGGKEVEIFTDGKVTVDGETPELPSTWAQTQLTLEDALLKVTDLKGFTVECDLEHDSCTLHVSGWYFGKVGGLFGTYNNEQSDDFTTAQGAKVSSVSQFAASWAVGRRCARSRNMARTSPSANSPVCSRLFHDKSSPLRPCFPVVDPVHFEAMCVNDVMETQGAECDIASLYVAECRRQEVPVSLPVTCRPEAAEVQFQQDLEEYVGQKF